MEQQKIEKLFKNNSKLENPIGYIGILIIGYFNNPQSKFYESILKWRIINIEPIIFTDTRLEEVINSNNNLVGRWLKYQEYIESIYLKNMNQIFLDWYYNITLNKIGNKRNNILSKVKYLTFYSDIARWYILNILNNRYKNKVILYCQASWSINLKMQNNFFKTFISDIENLSKNELIIYGMDRNLILDKEFDKKLNNTNTIYLICKGFDILVNIFLKNNYLRLIENIVIDDQEKLREMYIFGIPQYSMTYHFHIFYIIMIIISDLIKNNKPIIDNKKWWINKILSHSLLINKKNY